MDAPDWKRIQKRWASGCKLCCSTGERNINCLLQAAAPTHQQSRTPVEKNKNNSQARWRHPVQQAEQPPTSHLFDLLMELLMLGHISGYLVFRIAEACVKDGWDRREIVALSRTGCRGTLPGNVLRDIYSIARFQKCRLPQAIEIDLPLLDTSKEPPEVSWVKWPIYLAQDYLHTLYTHYREEFERKFLGSRGALETFWQQLRPNDPRLDSHPLKNQGCMLHA